MPTMGVDQDREGVKNTFFALTDKQIIFVKERFYSFKKDHNFDKNKIINSNFRLKIWYAEIN